MLGPVLHAVSKPDYALFILSGLLVWLFFSQGLTTAATSLVDQAGLIGKVAFPRAAVPAAAIAVQLVPFATMLVVLVPLSLILRGTAVLPLLLLPVLTAGLIALTLGLGLVVAPLHAYFRDVQPILTAALLPWFFISGVLFDLSHLRGLPTGGAVESLLRWANPIAPYITAFRDVIYAGTWPSAATILYVVIGGALALAAGALSFRRGAAELAVVI
jgi:ABC-type polysaccharide/polyol phosphate export permease